MRFRAHRARPSAQATQGGAVDVIRGFSLLEVVFASTILIIGLTSTAGVYATVSSSFAHQKNLAIATAIAEMFLEQVAVLPQSSPLLEPGTHSPRNYNADGKRVPSASKFTMTWEITENMPVAGIKEVTVDVTWVSRQTHQVTLFTYRE